MKYYLPAILPLCIAVSSAYAEIPTKQLETTLVTATRIEQTLDESLSPSIVFSKEDIEKLQARDLAELLNRVPGINFSASGSKGSVTSIYLRGTNDDHTLFLIDGQRFNSATLGSTSLQLIDPEQIERIEIVRGPRSSIYGSDAIGGVVQIFTKKGIEKPLHYIRTVAGSNDTWQISAGSRGKVDDMRYSVNVSHLESDGFDSFKDTTSPNDDDDGHRNSSATINLGYDYNYGGKIDLNYFYTKAKTESDDQFGSPQSPPTKKPYDENWIRTINLTFSSPITHIWSTKVALGDSTDDGDAYDDLDPSDNDNFRTFRESITWQNDLKLSDSQILTLGVDYYDDEVKSSTTYVNSNGEAVKNRDNTAFFGIYQLFLTNTDIQLGLREDDNEDFGAKTTANVSMGFNLDDNYKLILSYGEGYKAPTFNDLYWPDSGNPNLKSESSESYEFELRGNYELFSFSLNYYQTDISNLIDWAQADPSDQFSSWVPTNIEDAVIKGSEASIRTEIGGWQIAGAMQYTRAQETTTSKQLPNRPKKGITIDIDKNWGAWQLGFGLEANGERYGDKANSNVTSGYGILNARISYQVNDKLKAQLKLNNLFDKDYQTRFNYNEYGFNGFVALTYTL